MASNLYKWLIISLLFISFFAGAPVRNHPFHVSVTEVNHNTTDKALEITCKIFTDDFEKILAQNYKVKVDLINPPDKSKMDSLIKKYVLGHLNIKANGNAAKMNYLGFEHESEAVYSYFEVQNVPALKKIAINNSLMYDMFDDQVGIIHVTIAGANRKSTKLNYPDSLAEFSY
ncbi:MAG TPA: hypothetical protein PLU37_04735 [Chitinophagaceae bacterium]|nr:hypothetical protein [Chitinophagaceae bacterium]MCB9056713.1 hypothetical protein [Chitinophagales bacterium]HPG10815.1 hypothetical protein [Chitinophagaceae bacterium]HRX92757.1 hypothetical protein [Chitinophagaceae bacterium]